MKKLSDHEKLEKLRALGSAAPSEVLAIIACPYGDASHPADGDARVCPTCSRMDGSECIDALLFSWHVLRKIQSVVFPESTYAQHASQVQDAIEAIHIQMEAVREWREGKTK